MQNFSWQPCFLECDVQFIDVLGKQQAVVAIYSSWNLASGWEVGATKLWYRTLHGCAGAGSACRPPSTRAESFASCHHFQFLSAAVFDFRVREPLCHDFLDLVLAVVTVHVDLSAAVQWGRQSTTFFGLAFSSAILRAVLPHCFWSPPSQQVLHSFAGKSLGAVFSLHRVSFAVGPFSLDSSDTSTCCFSRL